ncbi:unnamed protein product [Withania somnifera]
MQADEDVGKIAMAVPLLVSKALELFLQDLCNRTYDITLKKGAKTMNSFHLKQCIQSFNVFDFLKDVVSRVPDLGGSDAVAESATKRRKVAEEDEHESDDDIKRNHMNETANNSGSGRGRGRGRGKGRGRGARSVEKADSNVHREKFEDPAADVSHQKDDEKPKQNDERMVDYVAEPAAADSKNISAAKCPEVVPTRNFDLNIDLNESVESIPIPSEAAPLSSTAPQPPEVKHEEIPGWSLSELEKMDIDPIQLANLNKGLDEEEEDYDEEG